MSEPIIIETPAPPTRERLVLVPVDACSEVREGDPRAKLGAKVGLTVLGTYARDATAADLERAGWVREMVEPTGPGTLAHLRADLRDMTARAEKAEATLAMHGRPTYVEAVERAEKAERERDDLLARINDAEEAARTLRAELARLAAPGEGACWACREDLGVDHERARQQPAKDRATDEELAQVYRKIYETHGGGTISVSHDDCRRAGVRAVAARVRQERCLVAQAVAADCDVHVTEQISGGWLVRVVAQTSSTAAGVSATVPRADAPSTLARLLGEVSRG